MIYFIQAETGHIKIGISKAPEKRLLSLQTASPYTLRLLGVIEGDELEEKELHEMFAESRISGEWFLPSPELLDYITNRLGGLSMITNDEKKMPGQGYGWPDVAMFIVCEIVRWMKDRSRAKVSRALPLYSDDFPMVNDTPGERPFVIRNLPIEVDASPFVAWDENTRTQ